MWHRREENAAGWKRAALVLDAASDCERRRREFGRFVVIFHAPDCDAIFRRVHDLALVFVSFSDQQHDVHVLRGDRNTWGKRGVLELQGWLPLSGAEGNWWTREDQPRWPGNRAGAFVICQS